MNRVENWDNVQPIRGGFQMLPAGAYKVRVIAAKGEVSKAGNEMLVLALDIAEGPYKNYYFKAFSFKKRIYPDAKWGCNYYQLTDKDEASVGRYRGLISVFEECNEGFHWDFDEGALKDKVAGCIFREEEYLGTDNRVHTMTKPWQIIPISDIRKSSIPEKKTLSPEGYGDSYGNIPDEEIPF